MDIASARILNCSFYLGSVMASARLKASVAESFDQQPVFKRFIIEFVKALGMDDRKAFRFWCRGLIPTEELSYIEVEDDGGLFKLIEFLQDNSHLSFNDMSFLKKFHNMVADIDTTHK